MIFAKDNASLASRKSHEDVPPIRPPDDSSTSSKSDGEIPPLQYDYRLSEDYDKDHRLGEEAHVMLVNITKHLEDYLFI